MSKRRPQRIRRPAVFGRAAGGGWGGGHVNVTPMIDVVMCLIVFYLIVGKLASQQLAAIELPASRIGQEEEQPAVLVVNILPREGATEAPGEGGVIVVQGREVAGPPGLEALVRQQLLDRPETVVQIRGGRRLPYAHVEPVLHACARAGAGTVQLMAERAVTPGGEP